MSSDGVAALTPRVSRAGSFASLMSPRATESEMMGVPIAHIRAEAAKAAQLALGALQASAAKRPRRPSQGATPEPHRGSSAGGKEVGRSRSRSGPPAVASTPRGASAEPGFAESEPASPCHPGLHTPRVERVSTSRCYETVSAPRRSSLTASATRDDRAAIPNPFAPTRTDILMEKRRQQEEERARAELEEFQRVQTLKEREEEARARMGRTSRGGSSNEMLKRSPLPADLATLSPLVGEKARKLIGSIMSPTPAPTPLPKWGPLPMHSPVPSRNLLEEDDDAGRAGVDGASAPAAVEPPGIAVPAPPPRGEAVSTPARGGSRRSSGTAGSTAGNVTTPGGRRASSGPAEQLPRTAPDGLAPEKRRGRSSSGGPAQPRIPPSGATAETAATPVRRRSQADVMQPRTPPPSLDTLMDLVKAGRGTPLATCSGAAALEDLLSPTRGTKVSQLEPLPKSLLQEPPREPPRRGRSKSAEGLGVFSQLPPATEAPARAAASAASPRPRRRASSSGRLAAPQAQEEPDAGPPTAEAEPCTAPVRKRPAAAPAATEEDQTQEMEPPAELLPAEEEPPVAPVRKRPAAAPPAAVEEDAEGAATAVGRSKKAPPPPKATAVLKRPAAAIGAAVSADIGSELDEEVAEEELPPPPVAQKAGQQPGKRRFLAQEAPAVESRIVLKRPAAYAPAAEAPAKGKKAAVLKRPAAASPTAAEAGEQRQPLPGALAAVPTPSRKRRSSVVAPPSAAAVGAAMQEPPAKQPRRNSRAPAVPEEPPAKQPRRNSRAPATEVPPAKQPRRTTPLTAVREPQAKEPRRTSRAPAPKEPPAPVVVSKAPRRSTAAAPAPPLAAGRRGSTAGDRCSLGGPAPPAGRQSRASRGGKGS